SNNQALNARQTGYILNSISADRTAQDNKLPVADDIFFVPALKGPRGTGWASEHVMGIYVIWKFAQSPDVAKQFLLDLLGHYRDAVLGSKLYNFPSFTGSVADPGAPVAQKIASGNKWLEQETANDPFGSNPPSKLKPISTALQWATNIGHPGPANPAESEVFDTFVLPTMFANAATGRMTATHAAVYLGGVLAGLACGWLVLRTSFAGTAEDRAATVGFWGFRGPLGAWVCIWGAFAMITSAPFDNWWHNAYGLDVKVLSPPHVTLALGIWAIQIGSLFLVLSLQNRSPAQQAPRLYGLLAAYAIGILLQNAATIGIEQIGFPNVAHNATYYEVTAGAVPILLVTAGRAVRPRWPAPTAPPAYMAFSLVMICILQLAPATPTLARVFSP